MSNRLRHRLRKLWAEGKLVGRTPSWMKALPVVEEATPEEVQQYRDQPVGVLRAELLSNDYCVGKSRLTGRLMISGGSCLSPENWDILITGSLEECMKYTNQV